MKTKLKMMLFYAAILFGLTLSSCANKGEGKTDPVTGRIDASKSTAELNDTYSDGLTADTDPTDTDPNDTNPIDINPTDIESTSTNPTDIETTSDASVFLGLSEVEKYLQSKGCAEYEIFEMMKIEKEDFDGPIEHVMYRNNHFYYKHHDNGQTYCNCGLYAVKRLLCALGKKGIVAKDLWYKYTDAELRDMIVEISGNEYDRNQGRTLDVWDVDKLMFRFLGVKPPYNGVWNFHDESYHCMYGVTEKTEWVGHNYYDRHNQERSILLPDGTVFLKYDGYGNLIFRLLPPTP
jgi:hypothetical protein